MTTATVETLVLIAAAAVLAPILSELSGRLYIPEIVFQIGLGIILGPYVLNIAHVDSLVRGLSDFGLTFLIFLAGYELDVERVRGKPLELATIGWVLSLVIGLAAAFALVSAGLVRDTVVVGLALTTTAMGTLVPILRDANITSTKFGAVITAIGTVGEFGPVVAVALLLTNKDPEITSLLLGAFIVVAVITVLLAARDQPPPLVSLLNRHLESSAQLPIRVSLLFIVLLVLLAETLGLDVLLGAFAAGVVVRLFTSGGETTAIAGKLEAIGFGFLIPVFFVVTGITFDLHVFIEDPVHVWRIGFFLILMLVARGAPVYLLYGKVLTRAQRAPMALFSATGLPLIVVITSIGLAEGRMVEVNAASLVAAGMLSVIVFPAIGLQRLRASGSLPTDADGGSEDADGGSDDPDEGPDDAEESDERERAP